MRKHFSFLITFVVVFTLFANSYAFQEQITSIILVRHAEKEADGGRDPELTKEGMERAQTLIHSLKDIKLDAVYSSPFKRTQNTAKPVAESQGLSIITYQVGAQGVFQKFIDDVTTKHKGETILIVSHSNVVPAFIKMIKKEVFNMREIPYINESVYDDLFIVSFTSRELVKVMNLKYGKATPIK